MWGKSSDRFDFLLIASWAKHCDEIPLPAGGSGCKISEVMKAGQAFHLKAIVTVAGGEENKQTDYKKRTIVRQTDG